MLAIGRSLRLCAIWFPAVLGACGLFVPEKDLLATKPGERGVFENIIVNNIKCELHKGVQDTLDFHGDDEAIQWLKTWGATVTLKITVDEKSALNPGVAVTEPLHNAVKVFPVNGNVTLPRSISATLGGSASADATRVETIAFTYAFKDLLAEGRIGPCDHEDGVMIQSDLKIGQFIFDKAFIASVPGSVERKKKNASPYSVFSYQVTFVVSYGVNGTPTWKFAQLTVDPSSPLFNLMRSKTDDVTITLGPALPATKTAPAQVSLHAEEVHFASLIGQAVATAIQSQQH